MEVFSLSSYSAHHWPPKSRGGRKTVKIPDEFHSAWHHLFWILYNNEVFFFLRVLRIITTEPSSVSQGSIDEARKRIRLLGLNNGRSLRKKPPEHCWVVNFPPLKYKKAWQVLYKGLEPVKVPIFTQEIMENFKTERALGIKRIEKLRQKINSY